MLFASLDYDVMPGEFFDFVIGFFVGILFTICAAILFSLLL